MRAFFALHGRGWLAKEKKSLEATPEAGQAKARKAEARAAASKRKRGAKE